MNIWEKKLDIFQNAEISVAAITDIGLKRKTNQDRYLIHLLSDNTILMAVADGLGGDPGGETASHHVMESLSSLTTLNNKENETLLSFFKKMDKDLFVMAKKNITLNGMATTLTTITIKDNIAHWVHSGDSRLYHIRDGSLRQITTDQTLSCFLIEEGVLTREQGLSHYSNLLLDQCIGCQDLAPESGAIRLESQDRIILSSDGLHRYVSEESICLVCKKYANSDNLAKRLVNMALDAGGKDNITVLIARVL